MYPELLNIGPLTVYSYGVMMGLAFVVGTFLAMAEAKRKGMDPDRMFDFIVIMLVVALISARLFYVVTRFPEFSGRPWWSYFDLRDGAGAIHGGLFGGIAAGVWYSRKLRTSFWRLSDALAPSLALGMMFGRTGCLLAGCCYGTLSTLPWAVTTVMAPGWRHPAQAYEALLDLSLFAFLWYYRKRESADGKLFLLYVMLYSVIRFFVEFFREPELPMGPLNFAQLLSVAMVVGSLVLMRRLKTEPNQVSQSAN